MELFMRHIVLGCLLTLFSTTLFAQLKTDLALLNLKGPVKKMGNESNRSTQFFCFGT